MTASPPDAAALLAAAHDRARAKDARLRGLLTPTEAWQLFSAGVLDLVDTRTHAERDLIGFVPGSIAIEWYDYPAKVRNERFLDQLREQVPPERPVAFLCRSGVRSNYAAELATQHGWQAAYNILEGFEGDKNAAGQRRVNGWQMAGLPWTQT